MDDSIAYYQICVAGELDEQWSDWFSGMTMTAGDGPQSRSILAGYVDQAALRGILNKLWDLNLVLIAVNRIEHPPSTAEDC